MRAPNPSLASRLRAAVHARRTALLARVRPPLERALVRAAVRRVHGPPPPPADAPEAFVVLCLVRDGAEYVEPFLAHYRALGAAHLIFLDNGSTDGTVERLRRAGRDVTVLRCRLPYRRYQLAMRQHLLYRYGRGRWSVLVDVDELLEHPRATRLPLRAALRALDALGANAVITQMLDMFPDAPVGAPAAAPEDGDFRAHHRWYDLTGIERQPYRAPNEVRDPAIAEHRGGIRGQVFGTTALYLTKHALVRWAPGIHLLSPHDVSGARLADFSCVLYHYKFVARFAERVRVAVERRNYWRESLEYRHYHEVLAANGAVMLRRPTARELRDVDELVEAGFLAVSERYEAVAGSIT